MQGAWTSNRFFITTMENENIQQTPLEAAEAIFADCAIIASKVENPAERVAKLNAAKEAATRYLDYQVDYWLQVRAEWQNIVNLSEKKS